MPFPGSEVNIHLVRGKPIEKMIIQKAKEVQPQINHTGKACKTAMAFI